MMIQSHGMVGCRADCLWWRLPCPYDCFLCRVLINDNNMVSLSLLSIRNFFSKSAFEEILTKYCFHERRNDSERRGFMG